MPLGKCPELASNWRGWRWSHKFCPGAFYSTFFHSKCAGTLLWWSAGNTWTTLNFLHQAQPKSYGTQNFLLFIACYRSSVHGYGAFAPKGVWGAWKVTAGRSREWKSSSPKNSAHLSVGLSPESGSIIFHVNKEASKGHSCIFCYH